MKNKNITLLVVLAISLVILTGFALWWKGGLPWGPKEAVLPVAPGDTTSEIQGALNQVDTGNLDQEFQDINKDLNSL